MDTSPLYIKLCEKAEEIQALWKYGAIHDGYNRIKQGTVYSGDDVLYQQNERYVWLPRQGRLQILSGLGWYLFDKTCVTWATTNPDYQRESKETLGLRVVMHTIHKKQWIDNKWILDKTIP